MYPDSLVVEILKRCRERNWWARKLSIMLDGWHLDGVAFRRTFLAEPTVMAMILLHDKGVQHSNTQIITEAIIHWPDDATHYRF